jgi:tripartite ATP-independent transporter DctM subunit
MTYLPLIALLALFLLNMPVAFAIAISTLSYFLFASGLPINIYIQKLVSSTHSFPLLAVPFFITAGIIMNYGGITKRLMALADALTGHMAGGLAQVNVVLSTLMGGLSGSANADAAMQSKILVPEMIKRGYGKEFSAVITACSAIIAPIIPPGIGLILYGFLADQSVGRLFLAGVIPGILLCVGLMVVVRLVSQSRGYRSSRKRRATLTELGKAFRDALWALLIPVGIIGGIRFGIFTPTEAGAVCVLYSLIIGFFAYRKLRLSDLPAILLESVLSTSVIMIIICSATALGFYMAWERIPMNLTTALTGYFSDPTYLLLTVNLFLLLVGMFVEGSASLILLTPLLAPIASAAGVDLVHFGIVIVLNLTIAGVTPPLGTLMYTTCSIVEVPIHRFSRELIPFLAVLLFVLMLITYWPSMVLFLPNLIMG